jgi:RNA-directed DNA polymerase
METLQEAYDLARKNNGAPGIDGVTFEQVEHQGTESFLQQLREELLSRTYRPMRVRKKEIPKEGGKVRMLSIPSIRDRVVQGALKLILEPIFEAQFQPGSYGYRPQRTAHEAVHQVAEGIVWGKTMIIDIDLRSYFDRVRHDILLQKVAARVDDDDVLRLLKQTLKASGQRGVPQGGVISPLLSNLYLDQVDRMLERANEVTRSDPWTYIQYVRFADDLVILIDGHPRSGWLLEATNQRLREELAALDLDVNEEKSRIVDLTKGESFGFLGFDFRRVRSLRGRWRPHLTPKLKKRTALLRKLKDVFRSHRSQPLQWVVQIINPILRGWVQYFRIGNSSSCFAYVRNWVERKIRRHIMRARKRRGFGWRKWSMSWVYDKLGLFDEYLVRYYTPPQTAGPAR